MALWWFDTIGNDGLICGCGVHHLQRFLTVELKSSLPVCRVTEASAEALLNLCWQIKCPSKTLRWLTWTRCAERAGDDVHSSNVLGEQRRRAASWRRFGRHLLSGVASYFLFTPEDRGRFDAERVKVDPGGVVLPRMSHCEVRKGFSLDGRPVFHIVPVGGSAYRRATGVIAV